MSMQHLVANDLDTGALAAGTSVEQAASRNMDERRIVTILFCDIAGSTVMAGELDPEEWADIMREAFAGLIGPVERYGGTVGRLMGDAVLAFFGAPHAHEDDPQRAILAGLAIVEALRPLRERVQAVYGFDFNVRVGINTGLVVVGEFGTQDRFEYTAMGDAINIASKTQQAAMPGTVYVAEATWQATAPLFEFEHVGQLQVPGDTRPEALYRVVRAVAASGRPWDIAGLRMPLVNRDDELSTLRNAYDDLRLGRGQVVLVCGDAGLGKSRLLEELRAYWEADTRATGQDPNRAPVAWLENRLISYDAQRPYGSLQHRLRQAFGLEATDSSDIVHDKIARIAQGFPIEFQQRLMPVMERVLALDGGSGLPPFKAESSGTGADAFQREVYAVMSEILRNWNRGEPLVFVGDDYHWLDASSADLVEHVIGLVEHAPILFVFAFRPVETSPAWRIRDAARTTYPDRCTEILLAPLDEPASARLVDALIDAGGDSGELRDLILEKADGNPLFIEEIVRSLRQRGVLLPADGQDSGPYKPAPEVDYWSISIPGSIQALLLQRIDSLTIGARRALLLASVVGRTFARDMLEAVAAGDSALDDALIELERLGLVHESTAGPEVEYSFRHTLVWETAYSTLSLRRRRDAHRRVAEAMEARHQEHPEEHTSDLGHHYYEAGDARAIRWLLVAADQADAVYAPAAVIDAVTKAHALARRGQERLPAATYLRRGRAFEMTGDYASARADFETAVALARAEGTPCIEWQALISLGMAWAERDYERTGNYFRLALSLAREMPDESTLAHSLNRMGNWHSNAGRPQEAFSLHEQALEIFQRLGHTEGIAETKDLYGLAHYLAGDFAASDELLTEAVALFRGLDDRQNLASALAMQAVAGGTLYSIAVLPANRPADMAIQPAEEALEIARQIGWEAGEAFALTGLADLLEIRGHIAEALEYGEQALRISEKIGHRQWTVGSHAALGATKLGLLQIDDALKHLEHALNGAREMQSVWWIESTSALLASAHIAAGEYARARDVLSCAFDRDSAPDTLALRGCWYQRAVLALESGNAQEAASIVATLEAGVDGVVPHLAWLRGRAFARLGRYDEAAHALIAARDGAVELDYHSIIWRIDLSLGAMYQSHGDTDRSEQAIARALDAVDTLARTLADTGLAERFSEAAYRLAGREPGISKPGQR